MSNLLLYTIVILSWGTSWLAIKFQLGVVHPQISVAYRFLLSGLLLLLFCFIKGKKFQFTKKQLGFISLQAILMFSTNYIFIYKSTQYLASGLVSIVFSTLTFMNIFNSRIFFGQKVKAETMIATVLGFVGILCVFNKELSHLRDTSEAVIWGFAFGLISTYSASLGNMTSVRLQNDKLPVLQTTAIGMFIGGVWTLLVAVLMGHEMTFSMTVPYVLSLLHLSIFASILAFLSYLTLLGRIGPSRAAYSSLVFPVIAISLSVVFEGYKLDLWNIMGFVLILGGNYIVMFKPNFLSPIKTLCQSKETKPLPR